MDVRRVIIRRSVSDADKKAGINLIRSIDMPKIQGIIRNFVESSDEDKMDCMRVIVGLDTAARLLGFCSVFDLSDFISIYGKDALL